MSKEELIARLIAIGDGDIQDAIALSAMTFEELERIYEFAQNVS